eukprot:m.50303 g.50303  ORF g.50303 m.50303 type:complete len:646 (+) comp7504_c1_seq2:1188-3125(+)
MSTSSEYLELFEDEPPKKKMTKPSLVAILFSVLPILTWFPNYKNDWKDKLLGDLRAGLTIGVLLVPQGLAYALLAELPVQYGLFSAFMPPLIYGLLGSSRELSVAPVAVVSLLTSSGVSQLYDPQTQTTQYIGATIALSLLLGLIQLSMGVFRLGFIVNFLSHPVLSGFTSASALIIGLSQLKHVLGINTQRSAHVHEVLESTFLEIKNTNDVSLGIGIATMVILLLWKYPPSHPKMAWFKKYFKPFPSAMIVVILMTVISSQLDLDVKKNVKVVGFVPGGLPTPKAPEVKDLGELVVLALTITIIGYMESMAIAKKFADDRGYRLDYNQELIALGAANIVGSVFQTYPTTGGFSRTAVNANAGAKTQAAGIFGVVVIAIALLAATELFEKLPKAVLGAIVIIAVAPLVDVLEPYRLWKVSKMESMILLITFSLTAFVGVEIGVGISVALSILVIVWNASRPHYTLEGRLPGTTVYRNINRYSDAKEIPGVKIFRFDASLFFANVTMFENKFRKRCLQDDVKFAILDLNACTGIDSAALHTLHILLHDAKHRNITILVANMKGPVRDIFLRIRMTDDIGKENFFQSVHGAVLAAQERMATSEEDGLEKGVLAMSKNSKNFAEFAKGLDSETSTDGDGVFIEMCTV